jgi:hypothetical protein
MFKLHEDWTSAWKWLQVQLGTLVLVAPLLYTQFPQVLQPYLPANVFNFIMAGLGGLIILNSVRAKVPQ